MSRWTGGTRLPEFGESTRLFPRHHIPGAGRAIAPPEPLGAFDLGLVRIAHIREWLWHVAFRCHCIGTVSEGYAPHITLPCWEHDPGRGKP